MASRYAMTSRSETHYQYFTFYGDGFKQHFEELAVKEAETISQFASFHEQNLIGEQSYWASPQAQILAAQNSYKAQPQSDDSIKTRKVEPPLAVVLPKPKIYKTKIKLTSAEFKEAIEQEGFEKVTDVTQIELVADPRKHTSVFDALRIQMDVDQVPSSEEQLDTVYPQANLPNPTKLQPHKSRRTSHKNTDEKSSKEITPKSNTPAHYRPSAAPLASLTPKVEPSISREYTRRHFPAMLLSARIQVDEYQRHHLTQHESSLMQRRDSSANKKHKTIHTCHVKKDSSNLVDALSHLFTITPNEEDSTGKTPLHYAALSKQMPKEGIELLFAQGERLKIQDNLGFTPWQYALLHQPRENISIFIGKLIEQTVDDDSVLDIVAWHYAVEKGSLIPKSLASVKEATLSIYAATLIFADNQYNW
ncbi:ankyrin repeat domain-containing protein [Parashewanella curva]|uniref:Ankyrin repeat domain-containing protein n=1 Tax=Parashewanella curva TaxID=2338552 RepID=A0A3L8PVS4_9GAMM|nr:ankyrin repeat domain-containing protein [Parashewanella curva]RLV59424.1 ankyrin repeat domain-containing protein [Parashewanella curva]